MMPLSFKFNSSGDKSEVLDIVSPDLKRFPEFVKAKRYECVLEPGDLLFIPGKTNTFTLTLFFLQPNLQILYHTIILP